MCRRNSWKICKYSYIWQLHRPTVILSTIDEMFVSTNKISLILYGMIEPTGHNMELYYYVQIHQRMELGQRYLNIGPETTRKVIHLIRLILHLV